MAVLWLAAGDAAAQAQFDRWTTENGLPQNSINDIVQTRDGYLWLATFGGLVRFDGLRFVVFGTETEGIRSQRVRALREVSEGTLWAGTEDGLLLRYQSGRFTTYDASHGLQRTEALRIDEDSGRNLWITWAGGVVTKFDRARFVNYRSGELEHRVTPRDARFSARLNMSYASRFDVWWSQDSAGLHCLVNGQVRTLIVGRDLPHGSKVTTVLTDVSGNLLVHTSNAGIVLVTRDRTTRHRAPQLPDALVPEVFVEGRNGNLWFSAGLQNLYRIADGQLEKRATFAQAIFSLYEDREKSIWAGTQHGLYRMRDVTVTTHAERDGLSSNVVFSILRTRRGAVWLGTWGGGLTRIEGGRLKTYGPAEGLPSNLVTAIHEDGSERLWVGTASGVSYLEEGRFRRYHDDRGLLNGSAWAIHRDRAGRLWFATDQGLIRVQHDEVTRYTTADGLSHDRVAALFEDRAGALWIGTFRGLTRFKDGVFTTFTERDGLVGDLVRAFYEDGDGVLWVGTNDGGLYRFKDGRLTRYTKKQGLYDNGVFQILEDGSGHFWIGCNRGIFRVSRRELNEVADGAKASVTSVALGAEDGLESLEVNGRQPAGMKAPDGRLWFPTMGGVAVIDPKAVRLNTNAPPVVIEEVRRGGEAVDFAAGLEIPVGTNAFEIRYTAPSFLDPEQIAFRYRLDGLDDDWIDARNRRAAVYHRVPPGRYRFHVIAANNDGVWNTHGAALDIVVLPPTWRTWWFIALASAASASLLLVAYQRRVSRLRREHGRQQAFSQQLIDSLEHERRRISNEIHDSLGQDLSIIKTRARLTRERLAGNDPTQEELHEIGCLAEKTSAELREIAYDLRPYHLDRVGLSATIDGMIRRVGRTCEIEFATSIANIDDCFRPEARIHVFRIAQEAVSNIVKHSRARQARVTIRRAGRRVEMRIEDDGQGLTHGNGTDGVRRTFGVMGMMERARLAGGDADVAPRPGGGTAVTARFRIEDSRDGA